MYVVVFVVGSTWRLFFLACILCSRGKHRPVWWYLCPCRMILPFHIILAEFLLNTALYPVPQICNIEMRELWYNPGRILNSLHSYGRCVKSSLNYVVYGSQIKHSKDTYMVCLRLCVALWGSSGLIYVPDIHVSTSPDFLLL